MCILAGFPTTLAKNLATPAAPFGLWFANANTLYVADEGDGFAGDTTLYTHAAAQTTAGIQKWIFNSTTKSWSLAYTLQTGLELGVPYTVKNYPTGNNSATRTFPGRPQPTVSATSPAPSTPPATSPSTASPPPSAATETRAPIPTAL